MADDRVFSKSSFRGKLNWNDLSWNGFARETTGADDLLQGQVFDCG